MTELDFGEHGLVDVECLIYDFDRFPGLLFIPLLELAEKFFIYIVGPVIDLEDMASVLCTGAEHCRYCDDG